jgi:transcriptional regulator with XRE-family HTH domain
MPVRAIHFANRFIPEMCAERTMPVKDDWARRDDDSAAGIGEDACMTRTGRRAAAGAAPGPRALPANYLRGWRRVRGLTQEQLAADAQTTHSTISRLEAGKTWFSRPVLIGVLEQLRIDAGQLFGEDPNDPCGIFAFARRLSRLPPERRKTAMAMLDLLLRESAQQKEE